MPAGNPPPRRVIPWPSWSRELWATKGEQAKVELRLAGGDSLVAESFVKGLSRGSYGVFGVKADDGNWTLTVVRWDTVERVVVKGVNGSRLRSWALGLSGASSKTQVLRPKT